jgi:sensor c-di-GMP phosphodiesterase-like protein
VLEVTERQPLESLTETRRVVATLQGLGVRIAIDDVGTGHSGLSYMLKLGVDIIKIDKSSSIPSASTTIPTPSSERWSISRKTCAWT